MEHSLIFDMPGEKRSKKIRVTFPGGFRGTVEERFRRSITEVLVSMLEELKRKYPQRVFKKCPRDLVTKGTLKTKMEKIWSHDDFFILTNSEYQKLREIVNEEKVIHPWEENPCSTISSLLLNEIWRGDVARLIECFESCRITGISGNKDEYLIVLRNFEKAISGFCPKIRLGFEFSLEITNPANNRIIKWRCVDNVSGNDSLYSLDQYCWQLLDSDRKPLRFGGFRDFEDVIASLRAA